VFFRQQRVGFGGRVFTALKFRTMKVDTDSAAHREFVRATMDAKATPTANGLYKLDQSDAVTRSGRWLRKTSLDELPQLINVLRGDCSSLIIMSGSACPPASPASGR
jgi:lipopolysaccharide/colanic/teichoic acid biosynthesis glycosyltransferase